MFCVSILHPMLSLSDDWSAAVADVCDDLGRTQKNIGPRSSKLCGPAFAEWVSGLVV